MKVTMRGKNIDLTEGIKEKITKKLHRLDKYFVDNDCMEAKVLIRVYPIGQKIEVTIPMDDIVLRAEVVHDDLYSAIDLVIDKLEGQIRKYKTKLSKRLKGNKIFFDGFSKESLEKNQQDTIVKTKSIHPKPMDLEEAIMQMELVGHSFFVYKDVQVNTISVVYKRHDGQYGLIETDA